MRNKQERKDLEFRVHWEKWLLGHFFWIENIVFLLKEPRSAAPRKIPLLSNEILIFSWENKQKKKKTSDLGPIGEKLIFGLVLCPKYSLLSAAPREIALFLQKNFHGGAGDLCSERVVGAGPLTKQKHCPSALSCNPVRNVKRTLDRLEGQRLQYFLQVQDEVPKRGFLGFEGKSSGCYSGNIELRGLLDVSSTIRKWDF